MTNTEKQTSMKIVLVGAGNLATSLGKALVDAGHDVVQVYSRTMESAKAVADIAGGAPTTSIAAVRTDADVYLVAVKDSVLPELVPQLCKGREQRVFLHTAGSMPMDVFKGMALHYGVLYPMQSFSKDNIVDFSEVPCFVEGSDDLALRTATELAGSVSGNVSSLSTDDRRYLHLAAVFACNFANHCYAMAEDILASRGLPFSVMLPLIDETARKVHTMSPLRAQTGPAVRYDENVIRSQSGLLRDNPFMKEIYDRMSLSIHRKADSNDKL